MKKLLAGAVLAVSMLLPSCSTTVVEKTVVVQEQTERFGQLRDATVMIEIQNAEGSTLGSCSAVAIAPQILLTAAHCDGPRFNVVDQGEAVKVRKDVSADLMLLFVEKMKIKPIKVGSENPEVDTKVVTVGFPLGMAQVVTEGRVQGKLQLEDKEIPEEALARLKGYMLVTSPIIFGNSGGPVFAKVDGKYELVGIVSAVAVAGWSPITHLAMVVKTSTINKFLRGV